LTNSILTVPDLDRPIIHDIVSRHVEDAAFFWEQRNQAVRARDVYLSEIQRLDKKIQAHLQGIRAASGAGWQSALEELERFNGEGEMFIAASAALFLPQNDTHIQTLLDRIIEAPELKRGFLSACAWHDSKDVYPVLQQFFQSSSTQRYDIAITVCALRRINPGEHLQIALSHEDTHIQARALRAVGELGLQDYQTQLQDCLTHAEPAQQFWAVWSLVLLGDRHQTLLVLCNIAKDPQHPFQERALLLAVRALPFSEACKLLNQLDTNSLTRQILIACGDLGAQVSMEWLTYQMTVSGYARIAGDAFTRITGIDLAKHHLVAEEDENDSGNENSHKDDRDLPLPDATKISEWWQTHQNEYEPNQRYLLGKKLDEAQLLYALNSGTQVARHGAALDLILSGKHTMLFNTHSMTLV